MNVVRTDEKDVFCKQTQNEMGHYVNDGQGRQGGSKLKTLKFQHFYVYFYKIHRLTRRTLKSIEGIRICIYFSFQWYMFQLYTTIITNLNV